LFPCFRFLFSEINRAGFSYHRYFYLTGVFHPLFDLFHDIASQSHCAQVVNFFGLDQDSDLTAGLNSKRFLDTFETVGNIFQRFERFR